MEEDNQIQDISSYGMEDIDITMPEIPMPVAQSQSRELNEDVCEVAFKFGFIGAGQGGSRIAESFHRLGYRKVCAINTAQQDLNTIKLEDKFKLCVGQGGAGKDPSIAEGKILERREDALDFMRDTFGDEFDRVFICAGAGGGSGAGMVCPLVEIATELQNTVRSSSRKVGVILALPKISEGKKVNANAFHTLTKIWSLLDQGMISPLILLDNERINSLYPGLAVGPFWNTANSSMAGLFHLFNLTASKDSSYTSFDSNDFKQLLDSGLIVFGASPVPNWQEASSISKNVRDNLRNNILSGGIEIHSGNSAGVVMIGGKEVLDKVPQQNLDRAFEQFTRILGPNSIVHRGIYSGDQPTLTVYTVLGGLGRPNTKISELRVLGEVH